MHPLCARDLHPVRSVLDAAGMDVERRAHAEHQLGVELGEVLIHKPLLLGRAQAYPKEIGLGFRNHADEFGFLFRVQGTKGRSVCTHDFHAGKTAGQRILELFGDAIVSSVKKVRVAFLRREGANPQHHVRTSHLAHLEETPEPPYPDGGAAVGCGEDRVIDDALQIGIDLRFHDALYAGNADVALGACGNGGFNSSQGTVHVSDMDLYPEDSDANVRCKIRHGRVQIGS